jgi:hypothetical protein
MSGTMTGVFDLTDIFEKIVDTLDDSAFAKEDFVGNIHELVLHVFLEFGDKVNTVGVEFFKERLGKVAPVSKDFSKHFLGEFGYDRPVSVVNIAGSKAESDDFAFVVDGKVEFEAIEPASRTLTLGGKTLKNSVRVDSPRVAYIDCRRI